MTILKPQPPSLSISQSYISYKKQSWRHIVKLSHGERKITKAVYRGSRKSWKTIVRWQFTIRSEKRRKIQANKVVKIVNYTLQRFVRHILLQIRLHFWLHFCSRMSNPVIYISVLHVTSRQICWWNFKKIISLASFFNMAAKTSVFWFSRIDCKPSIICQGVWINMVGMTSF